MQATTILLIGLVSASGCRCLSRYTDGDGPGRSVEAAAKQGETRDRREPVAVVRLRAIGRQLITAEPGALASPRRRWFHPVPTRPVFRPFAVMPPLDNTDVPAGDLPESQESSGDASPLPDDPIPVPDEIPALGD